MWKLDELVFSSLIFLQWCKHKSALIWTLAMGLIELQWSHNTPVWRHENEWSGISIYSLYGWFGHGNCFTFMNELETALFHKACFPFLEFLMHEWYFYIKYMIIFCPFIWKQAANAPTQQSSSDWQEHESASGRRCLLATVLHCYLGFLSWVL